MLIVTTTETLTTTRHNQQNFNTHQVLTFNSYKKKNFKDYFNLEWFDIS